MAGEGRGPDRGLSLVTRRESRSKSPRIVGCPAVTASPLRRHLQCDKRPLHHIPQNRSKNESNNLLARLLPFSEATYSVAETLTR
jgi:hypothetical protein